MRSHDTSTAFVYFAEVATALADAPRAARLYELYAPYAGMGAVSGTSSVHGPGACDRYLGLLAATFGRWDEPEKRYEAAFIFEEGLRAPPLLALTRHWYGRTLLEPGWSGDDERATDLLRSTLATAEDLGMARLAVQAAELIG